MAAQPTYKPMATSFGALNSIGTKPCPVPKLMSAPTSGKQVLAAVWAEVRRFSHNTREHAAHIEDIPGVLVLVTKEDCATRNQRTSTQGHYFQDQET